MKRTVTTLPLHYGKAPPWLFQKMKRLSAALIEVPGRFSFAPGGKDSHPFLVDKETYEHSIDFLKICLEKAKVGDREKLKQSESFPDFRRIR